MVPMIRGTAMLANRAFCEQNWGAAAFDQVLRGMPREHFDALSGIPMAQEWYPLASLMAFIDEAARVFECRDYYERIGAFQAEYDLRLVHRFLLKFTTPLWVFDRGGKLWNDYHNSGRWVLQGPGPRAVVATLHDFAFVNANHCRIVTGFLERIGQLTGTGSVKVTHRKCRATGSPACVFEGKW